jgi:hypothetical protein
LSDEYRNYKEKYKGLEIDDADPLKKHLKIYVDKVTDKFDITFDGFLDHSYKYYCNVLEKCRNARTKNDMRDLRSESHLRIGWFFLQDYFARMYWVVQDAVYFYISKMNPQMHEINLLFIDLFKKKRKLERDPFYQPQKEVFDFHATPSCPDFKYFLLTYVEKYLDEIEYSPIFTMFLYPLTLTNYGKTNILDVLNYFGIKLHEYADKHGVSLLRYHFQRYKIRNLNRMKKLKDDIKLITKEAENDLRVNENLPKIGENWIEETRLYNLIKNEFPALAVIQHGKPNFLGKQHYDIWIPKIKTAIEYQGQQHYEPVDFFGGISSFNDQLERDKRKYNLSVENGVNLIYVSEGYNFENIKSKIKV